MRRELSLLRREQERLRLQLGSIEARLARQAPNLEDAEFRAFSQFGEDGIIQWLVARVPIPDRLFVELGVEDYREANTRFLVERDGWHGVVVDSGTAHLDYLSATGLDWRYGVEARSAFITRDNIQELLADVPRDLGILSIDIDGNDYWILDQLTSLSPRIVIAEYNSVFGPGRPVSVPYDATFERAKAHWSLLYFGASLPAFGHLLGQRGYRLVGSNRTGLNAFFVRGDVAGGLPDLAPGDAWVESRFCESRDRQGRLSFLRSHAERRAVMADMPLVDVATGERLTVADLDELN
jgi:hypothetical protein